MHALRLGSVGGLRGILRGRHRRLCKSQEPCCTAGGYCWEGYCWGGYVWPAGGSCCGTVAAYGYWSGSILSCARARVQTAGGRKEGCAGEIALGWCTRSSRVILNPYPDMGKSGSRYRHNSIVLGVPYGFNNQ
eukprot:346782-Rhodomonas_salina.1